MRFSILTTLCSYIFIYNTNAASTSSSTPPTNNYTVTQNGVTCVAMTAGIQIALPYKGDTKNLTTTVTVPGHPYTNGSCGDSSNTLNVYFNDTWSLSFVFRNTSTTNYQMDTITLNYVKDKVWFPNISSSIAGTGHLVTRLPNGTNAASVAGSYQCQGQSSLALNGSATIYLYDLQYRAFGKTNSTWFSDSDIQTCLLSSPQADVDSAVAVSVGIALGVMIVVVVAVYFSFTKAKGHKYGYT